jgi:hypothetical protein
MAFLLSSFAGDAGGAGGAAPQFRFIFLDVCLRGFVFSLENWPNHPQHPQHPQQFEVNELLHMKSLCFYSRHGPPLEKSTNGLIVL